MSQQTKRTCGHKEPSPDVLVMRIRERIQAQQELLVKYFGVIKELESKLEAAAKQNTQCGGNTDDKKQIHKEAHEQTVTDMDGHPCGCEVCGANYMLFNLRQARVKRGLDPVTGNAL